jgi:RimJ/RimL family protein N-acetyltransferase
MRPETAGALSNAVLRPFERHEVALYAAWMADPAVVGPFVEPFSEPDSACLAEYDATAGWRDVTLRRWMYVHEGVPAGFGHAWRCDRYEAHWEHGYVLLPALRGRGHGTNLARLTLQATFAETSTTRVQAITACQNLPALAVWRRTGIVLEGRLRQFMTLRGRRLDCYLGAALN